MAGYRLVQTWFSAYWEPVIAGYSYRTEHVPDPRAVGFGAGIHNDLGLVRLRDSVVERNTVATHLGSFGGAVSSVLGAVLIEDTRLNGNEANASTVLCSGGGVFNFAGYLRATGTTLNHNRVNAGLFLSSGGGLKNTLLGVAELRRCEFDGNVSGGGGGIANDYLAHLELHDSTVTGNRISGIIGANGGGIRNEAGGRATLERCTIADNEARGKAKGAGFYNQCEQLRIGPADAPIIPIAVTTAVLRNCTLSGNRAIGRGLRDLPLLAFGGGLYNGSFNLGVALLDLHSCTIAGNEARDGLVAQGGGLYTSSLSSLKLKPAENIPGLSIVNLANNLFSANRPSALHNSLLGVTAHVNSEGYNLDSDGTGAAVTGSSGFRRGDAIGESDDADSITAAQDALLVLNHVWTGFHRPDLRFGSWAAVAAPWTGASEDALRAEARRLVTDALHGAARLTALVPQADGGLRLEYALPPGRRARLEAAPTLGAPWRPVAGPELAGPADGRGVVQLPAPKADAQFYRLELLPLELPQ